MDTAVFHHTAIYVRSIEKSINFYLTLFGFQSVLVHNDGNGVIAVVHLKQQNSPFILELLPVKAKKKRAADNFHLGFSVHKWDEFYMKLKILDVHIVRGPFIMGQEQIVFIRDPDNYLLEINDHL